MRRYISARVAARAITSRAPVADAPAINAAAASVTAAAIALPAAALPSHLPWWQPIAAPVASPDALSAPEPPSSPPSHPPDSRPSRPGHPPCPYPRRRTLLQRVFRHREPAHHSLSLHIRPPHGKRRRRDPVRGDSNSIRGISGRGLNSSTFQLNLSRF